MNKQESMQEVSEEESSEERIFNMVQSVLREMKESFRIENLSNIELVHLKRIVGETLESRDQIEDMRQRIIEEGDKNIRIGKSQNSDIASKTETEIIMRWLDQLYGINPTQVPDLFSHSHFYQIKIEDKTTGDLILLRRTGLEYQKYDENKKQYATVRKSDIYSKKDYLDALGEIDEDEERRNSLGHELKHTESHDDRLLDYINRKREEAHLM